MTTHRPVLDPADISVIGHALHSVAVEMGAALRRTAFSPNIKERRDYSSAVFSADGDLIAMGDDMPVHLGSMPMSVAAVLVDLRLRPGDVALLNDPYRGGTHLPDITMVAPVFLPGRRRAAFYVANRAHHADVAQIVRRQWLENLGIDLELEGVELKIFGERLHNKDYAIARASWTGDYMDPSTFTDKYLSNGTGRHSVAV